MLHRPVESAHDIWQCRIALPLARTERGGRGPKDHRYRKDRFLPNADRAPGSQARGLAQFRAISRFGKVRAHARKSDQAIPSPVLRIVPAITDTADMNDFASALLFQYGIDEGTLLDAPLRCRRTVP